MTTPAYEVCYVERAAAARDRLDDRRRPVFDRGIAALARDPFPRVSRAVGATSGTRLLRLTRDILVEYVVSPRRVLIVTVEVFDDADVLVPDV
ncbi:hypothetical protein [Streptomyces sp. L2]|uniref:hypothetical protein n=1 Tax=Streptomyces sp. L2 TaxID=2162665 RepID=UPI00101116AE|nr:hypothetical protein [Streptomyces sp. L2]